MGLSRLNGWPARSPADASPLASRPDTHGSGPTWIATPSVVSDSHRLLLAGLPAHYQLTMFMICSKPHFRSNAWRCFIRRCESAQPGACMLKSELIARIAEQNPHLYERDVEAIVNAILGTITAALVRGDRVELRGFGIFAVKKRDARTGRNPRNGGEVAVSEKVVPTFKTSRDMHHQLNPGEE